MPIVRLGVELTPLKARIFDAIKRAGPGGIEGRDLLDLLGLNMKLMTLKVHASQINIEIAGSGHRIVGRGGYRLVRTKGNDPAVNGAASLNSRSARIATNT